MRKLLLLFCCYCPLLHFSQTIGLTQFATGLTAAIGIEHPANDPRLFVVQQGGLIRIVNPNGTVNATPFLNISSLTNAGGERGLLGLAFHPNYASNGLFFINYTNTSGHTVIARYGVSANPDVANSTGTILMTINQPAANHNGGTLKFGADGYLYIGMGDGGGAGDTSGYAQNMELTHPNVVSNPTRIYLGKMLRIDVDTVFGSLNYGIPPTNPYAAQAGKEEIWAIGLRNPWKFSFNRLNGDLWLADVGQSSVEEIDKIASPLPNAGLNFGWRCYEGNAVYSTSIGPCPAYAATVAPFTQYSSASGARCSITGGHFYTGTTYPNFQNKYFFADYCTAEIGMANAAGVISWGYDGAGYAASLGEDSNGELYISLSTEYSATTPSTIYKIIDTSLGADSFSRSGLRLYPNPARTELFLKNENNIPMKSIRIVDLSGKTILQQGLGDAELSSIAVSGIAKGMYLTEVESRAGELFQTKLVIE